MLKCYFDGACEPVNPGGNMGLGGYVDEDEKNIFFFSEMIPKDKNNTNNIAEYKALLNLLHFLIDYKHTDKEIIIYGDSKLVINQMWGTWNMSKGLYIPFAIKCKKLLKQFDNLKGQWIPREENQRADDLSKDALLKNKVKITKRD